MNGFELAARARKTLRLVEQIDAVFGPVLDTMPPHSRAGMISACIPTWTARCWGMLADWARVNEPSEKTIDEVARVFARRAQQRPGPRPVVKQAIGREGF